MLGFAGTTDWSGWGFKTSWGFRVWFADDANAVTDLSVFTTNTVFNPFPTTITNSTLSRLETDFHLALGIPALSPPTGRVSLQDYDIVSYDLNTEVFMGNNWPRNGDEDIDGRFLHSDVKNVAYFYVYRVFDKIVEVGGLK